MEEIAKYGVDSERLSIDPQAMIISPGDIKGEAPLVEQIGSTGQGVGFATARRIKGRVGKETLARDVKDSQTLHTGNVETAGGSLQSREENSH